LLLRGCYEVGLSYTVLLSEKNCPPSSKIGEGSKKGVSGLRRNNTGASEKQEKYEGFGVIFAAAVNGVAREQQRARKISPLL
jgi:hypothetical protein